MLQRISNSWQLTKASAQVLQADKELLIFPIVSFIGVLLVTATFAIPTFLAGVFDSMATESGIPIAGYIIAFFFYLTQYFVIFFANTALVGAAMIRLDGGDPTVGDGFRIAMKHSGNILGYAIISATVGMILRAISERGGWIGSLVASFIGLGWNLATYLVVPVLVMEEIGPVDAIKRSGNLLKKTWGEQIVGNAGIGTVFGFFTFAVILLAIPFFILAVSTESMAIIMLTIVLVVLTLATLGLISSALTGIYTAAVYRYAVHGDGGAYFDKTLIANTFRQK